MSTEVSETLLDQVRSRAGEAEQSGRLPQPLVEHLVQQGYLRMAVPSRLGGDPCPLPSLLQRLSDLAEADASTAWMVMAWAQAQIIAARLPQPRYQELFTAGPDVIMAATSAGTGTAQPTGGGLDVSGQWRFASGIAHARWILVHCDLAPAGSGRQIGVLLDRACVVVDDTWRVLGLRATASHGLQARRVHVRATDTYELDAAPCQAATSHSRLPFRPSFALHMGAVALGVAQATIHHPLPRSDTPNGGPRTPDQALGTARLAVESAQSLLQGCARHVQQQIDTGEAIEETTAQRMAAVGAYAAQVAVDTTVTFYRAGGSAVIFDDHPLQRRLRDALTISQHINVSVGKIAALTTMARGSRHQGDRTHS